jgi:hypothetical protein
MGKAKKAGKPFFVWMNPTPAHVNTYLAALGNLRESAPLRVAAAESTLTNARTEVE